MVSTTPWYALNDCWETNYIVVLFFLVEGLFFVLLWDLEFFIPIHRTCLFFKCVFSFSLWFDTTLSRRNPTTLLFYCSDRQAMVFCTRFKKKWCYSSTFVWFNYSTLKMLSNEPFILFQRVLTDLPQLQKSHVSIKRVEFQVISCFWWIHGHCGVKKIILFCSSFHQCSILITFFTCCPMSGNRFLEHKLLPSQASIISIFLTVNRWHRSHSRYFWILRQNVHMFLACSSD